MRLDGNVIVPSAVNANVSHFLCLPIHPTLGEISLTGKVLPVGGIKEKVMAARRAGIKCIIFPEQNRRDYEEMPAYLKQGLDARFAEDYSTVYDVAFSSNK